MDLSRLVGNTPLIKLGDRLYAKFETYNPSGSIKDRIGYYILKKAEERGDLQPGDTIVEATSGNTGIAVSMFGANKGYPVIIIMPSNMSEERKQMMRMFGAEVIEVQTPATLMEPSVLGIRSAKTPATSTSISFTT
jgi:cysteine synthase